MLTSPTSAPSQCALSLLQARTGNSTAASQESPIATALSRVHNQEITSPPRVPLSPSAEETRAQLQQLGGGTYPPIRDGDTALSMAVIDDRPETVAALLSAGRCMVDQPDSDGMTPLLLAACKPDGSILRQLLRAGANPNGTSPRHGATALMAAAESRRHDNVTLLLEAGADVTICTREGDTALGIASDDGIKTQLRAAYAKRLDADGL